MTDFHPFNTATAVATAIFQTTVRIPFGCAFEGCPCDRFSAAVIQTSLTQAKLKINFPLSDWKPLVSVSYPSFDGTNLEYNFTSPNFVTT